VRDCRRYAEFVCFPGHLSLCHAANKENFDLKKTNPEEQRKNAAAALFRQVLLYGFLFYLFQLKLV